MACIWWQRRRVHIAPVTVRFIAAVTEVFRFCFSFLIIEWGLNQEKMGNFLVREYQQLIGKVCALPAGGSRPSCSVPLFMLNSKRISVSCRCVLRGPVLTHVTTQASICGWVGHETMFGDKLTAGVDVLDVLGKFYKGDREDAGTERMLGQEKGDIMSLGAHLECPLSPDINGYSDVWLRESKDFCGRDEVLPTELSPRTRTGRAVCSVPSPRWAGPWSSRGRRSGQRFYERVSAMGSATVLCRSLCSHCPSHICCLLNWLLCIIFSSFSRGYNVLTLSPSTQV